MCTGLQYPKLAQGLEAEDEADFGCGKTYVGVWPLSATTIANNGFAVVAAGIPPEDQSPSLVHADRMPTRESTLQSFKMIAGRYPKIGVSCSIIQHLKFSE